MPANATSGPIPAGAEMIAPEEFRRRHATGELVITTASAQEEQRTTRRRNFEAERDFLESKTDLSADATALLAQLRVSADLEGKPIATLAGGQHPAQRR